MSDTSHKPNILIVFAIIFGATIGMIIVFFSVVKLVIYIRHYNKPPADNILITPRHSSNLEDLQLSALSHRNSSSTTHNRLASLKPDES